MEAQKPNYYQSKVDTTFHFIQFVVSNEQVPTKSPQEHFHII